ncbi:MAG: hypothetical protein AVDCRST_MAG83-568, partial [uncultured Arthrobacter sp.]
SLDPARQGRERRGPRRHPVLAARFPCPAARRHPPL